MKLPLKAYWELLAAHIRPQRARFGLLAGLLLVSIGLQVANPQIISGFIDAALGGAALSRLVSAALLFLGIAVLQQALSVGVVYLSQRVAWSATNALRAELASHCLNLDMGFHNAHTPGELIERIDGDVAELATFFSQFVVILAGNLLLLAGILTALFLVDWRVGLAFSVFAALSLLVLQRVRDIALPQQKALRQAEADLYGFVEEQLAGTEDIRSSGAVDFSLRELYRRQKAILIHDRQAKRRGWFIELAMGSLLAAGNILAISSGYLLFTTGAITIGTVYLFVHYVNLLETPIWTLIREVKSFQTIGACVERLTELRAIQPGVVDGTGALPLSGSPALAFEGVSFGYNGADPVLRDLSFTLEPAGVLGLLGRTGSGKSSLVRLVFRLYDPIKGRILLDGRDIRSAKLASLHRRVAMVTQEVQLFQGTVRDNLTFFDQNIPDEQIQAAITRLGLADWFAALPAGLDTHLEGGGRSLSAGEAQILALTRVFLRDPGLVILDEASARLDPATEQRLEQAIDRLLEGRTAIIIAHRLGTLQRAGEVMILENGRVREYGRRTELAADPASRFSQLLQTGGTERTGGSETRSHEEVLS
jgi:ABC-type multidrug transport system fused ATPase/permease subunit